MTKIMTNLLEMTEQNLTDDDIFNENLIIKRKKVDYVEDMLSIEQTKLNNHAKVNNKAIDLNLKRKVKNLEPNENYAINKMVQPNINISIDKDSNRTIRLELRHPDNQCIITDYKINDESEETRNVLTLEGDDLNGYTLKDNVRSNQEKTSDEINVHNDSEYINDTEENKVSNYILKDKESKEFHSIINNFSNVTFSRPVITHDVRNRRFRFIFL
ncbi:unnamed protein product, partial [Brenthis ino]